MKYNSALVYAGLAICLAGHLEQVYARNGWVGCTRDKVQTAERCQNNNCRNCSLRVIGSVAAALIAGFLNLWPWSTGRPRKNSWRVTAWYCQNVLLKEILQD